MRDGDPRSDPCARLLLTEMQGLKNRFAIVSRHHLLLFKMLHELNDRWPAFGRLHLGDDLFNRQEGGQVHK